MNIIEGNDREDDGVVNDDDGENRYDVEKMDMLMKKEKKKMMVMMDTKRDKDKEDEEEDDGDDDKKDKYADFVLLTLI